LTGANVLVPIDRFLVVRVGHGNHGGFHGSKEEWVPLTKFGQLGKTGKLRKVEEVYLHSLAIKEHQVLETLSRSKKSTVSWRSNSSTWRWIALGSGNWIALTDGWTATATPTLTPTFTPS
jgi:hypothetical protein